MSDFRAIAAVTATLQRVLQAAIQADVPGATVSTVRPGEGAGAHLPTTGLNLFLYQVTPNAHRGGDDLPARRPDGSLLQRPAAPVELHYLLSCYGDDLTLEPQRVLGSALAFLHAQPQLTRAQVQAAVADPASPFLAASDLAEQMDPIRCTPTSLTLDELSRLWSVFLQTHYVLSATFRASTVRLERALDPSPSLPARAVQVAAVPFRWPRIDRVVAAAGPGRAITPPGAAIAIEGADLLGPATVVEVDGTAVPVLEAEAGRLTLALPAGLAAGPHAVLVRQGVAVGAGTRPAFASGTAAFVLQPVVARVAGQPDIAVTAVQGTGAAPRSTTIEVGVLPPVGPRQRAMLELLSGGAVVHRFAAPEAGATPKPAFAASGLAAGEYLVVVRVDGAASPLDLDPDGAAVGPKVTVP